MAVLIVSLHYFFQFLYFMILIRCVLSWIPGFQGNSRLVRLVDLVTEPILKPIRDLTFRYLNLGVLDISPIFAIFLLQFAEHLLFRLLYMMKG